MYPVSTAYKTAVNASLREWRVQLEIETATQTFSLTGANIVEKSLKVKENVISGNVFSLGGVAAADLSVSIVDDGRYDNVQLNGAILRPQVGLKLASGQFEWVPLGVFVVDEAPRAVAYPGRPFRALYLQALDNMVRFDTPFKDVAVTFPCTALVLLSAVCLHCGVTLATTDFLNKNYVITSRPEGDMTCRDIVSSVAELAGGWSKCNRQGQLTLGWFKNPESVHEDILDGNTDTADGGDFSWWDSKIFDGGLLKNPTPDVVLDPMNRLDFAIDDGPITISGVTFETDDTVLLAGDDRYTIDITDNPLIQHDEAEVLNNILDRIDGLTFLPFKSNRRDDPAMQAGDLVEHTGVNGQTYRTIITEYSYVFGGKCLMVAVGASKTAAGYKSTLSKKVSQLKRKIYDKQVQLDALDLAIKNASQMIAGIWGGHVINGDTLGGVHQGNMYIADSNNPAEAVKVWRWNLGGLGYSDHGINGPFAVAITADGSIVASLITASMVQTGLLQSLNGKSWIDMDNGAFSLGDGALQWSAANGFKAVSAERLTGTGAKIYARIGKDQYGIDRLAIYHTDDESQPMYTITAHNVGISEPRVEVISRGEMWLQSTSALGGTKEIHITEDTVDITAADGGSNNFTASIAASGISFKKNGQPYGLNGTKTIGDNTIVVKNGIIESIT